MLIFQKLWSMLNPSQHRSVVLLLGLMLISMALETLGIGLVFPILKLITKDNLASEYPILEPWLDRLGNPDQGKLILFAMLAFLGVTVIKVLFLGFLAWQQSNFTLKVNTNLSLRLFTLYLRQPYAFHLQRNSAQHRPQGKDTSFQFHSSRVLLFSAQFLRLLPERNKLNPFLFE